MSSVRVYIGLLHHKCVLNALIEVVGFILWLFICIACNENGMI